MASLPLYDYYSRPSNHAFHDLTSTVKPPPNFCSLLGLGLKFIPTPYQPTSIKKLNEEGSALPNLKRSLQLRYFFLHSDSQAVNPEYSPKLNIPSDWDPPLKYFPKVLPNRLKNFEIKL